MDLLLEGILIAIMMAIILIFVVYEYSAFFAPKSSIDYFNTFVGMADSACTSIQTASNVQFSSPKLLVFQIYDDPSCNSVLSSNSNIFSPNSYALSSLSNNYDVCYATANNPSALGVSSGNQYFFQSTSNNNIYFYLSSANKIPGSANISKNAQNNQISTNGVEVNSSNTFSLILSSSKRVYPQNYSFNLDQYSNTTFSIEVYFNGLSTCSVSYSDLNGIDSLSIVPPCQQIIHNVTLQVTPVSSSNTAINYQVNLTGIPNSNPSNSFLSQQCTSLPSLVSAGIIQNGSIVCEPISCGGHSFMLTDQSNRPFLGLYAASYTFLGIQSGVNDLQIVNSYSEHILNSSIMDRTIFEESGLTAGSSWSVTYNGKTKSSTIGLSGSGNTISFSFPSGNYSFTIPKATEYIQSSHSVIERTAFPNVTNGYAIQGTFVPITFSIT